VRFRDLSPLRYPGGKARLAGYLTRLLAAQETRPRNYAEPFAGGAGAALRLLESEEVHSIFLNDLSPGIAAFWRVVFNDTERLAVAVENEVPSIASWQRARDTYFSADQHSDFDLGFATFRLNRFNRSGIIEAGPIGGLDQTGKWAIGARFNASGLAARIRYIGGYRNRVHLTQLDGRAFVTELEREAADALLYVDPPYLVQGERLYLDSLTFDDHVALADTLQSTALPWLLTYDADERITESLYRGLRCAEFDIAHTAQRHNVGTEYAVFSAGLRVPGIDLIPNRGARWVVAEVG
jgi:DNA adenine methylase